MLFSLNRLTPVEGEQTSFPILFLHGFMGCGDDFATVMTQLGDRFCYLAPDLPGHGQNASYATADYGFLQVANHLIQWLDCCNIQQCYLVGYSLGGRLALYLALHYPEQFLKVVLESASPGLKTETERQDRLNRDRTLAQKLVSTDFPDFLEFWYSQPLFATLKSHPQFPKLLQKRLQNNPTQLAEALVGMSLGAQPSLWETLATCKVPLLLLAGEQDTKFRVINEAIAQCCPTATLQIIPHCGHNIHFEQPQAFVAALRNFFTSRDRD